MLYLSLENKTNGKIKIVERWWTKNVIWAIILKKKKKKEGEWGIVKIVLPFFGLQYVSAVKFISLAISYDNICIQCHFANTM